MEMERTVMQNELEELNASVNTLEQTVKSLTSARYETYYYHYYHYHYN